MAQCLERNTSPKSMYFKIVGDRSHATTCTTKFRARFFVLDPRFDVVVLGLGLLQ